MSTPDKNKKLTFAEINLLPQGERYTLYKTAVVKPFTQVKNARETIVNNLHTAMKVAAQLKRDYTRMLNAHEIPADCSEAKFFEDFCGGDLPSRVKQLATFSNALGLETDKPMIPEAIIDAHSINTLEKAAPIIAHERKHRAEVWKVSPFTLEVIEALTTPGEATKKLADIRKRQNPKEEEAETEATPTASLVLMLMNHIQEADDNDAGYEVFRLCQELAETWGKNTLIPAERYADWQKRIEQAAQPIQQTAPAGPAERPAAETPAQAELAEAVNG
jgi:hypothetical protein